MLEIIVHSLYSNKDVFLREVISNGSDALDKIAFLNVSNPGLLGDTPELEMRIRADRENRVLEIRDTGIGMTREHLVKASWRAEGWLARVGCCMFEQLRGRTSSFCDASPQFASGMAGLSALTRPHPSLRSTWARSPSPARLSSWTSSSRARTRR